MSVPHHMMNDRLAEDILDKLSEAGFISDDVATNPDRFEQMMDVVRGAARDLAVPLEPYWYDVERDAVICKPLDHLPGNRRG